MTHYETLGLTEQATADEITKSFRELAKKYHPDKNVGKDTTEEFKKILKAYEILNDLGSKVRYDFELNKRKPLKPKPVKSKTQSPEPIKTHSIKDAYGRVIRTNGIWDAPPPAKDLWGQPLEQQQEEEDSFKDIYKNSYENNGDVFLR